MESRRPRRLAVPVLLATAGVAIALLIASQLLLPSLAARQIAGDLERFGARPDVTVEAFPALKVLAGRADRVEVRLASARVDSATLLSELRERRDADELDVRVGALEINGLRLRDVRITERGDDVTATATVASGDLREGVGSLTNVRILPGQDGVRVTGQLDLFGQPVAGRARVRAVDGRLVAELEGLPLGPVTLVEDPDLRVTGVAARPVPGGHRLSVTGVAA